MVLKLLGTFLALFTATAFGQYQNMYIRSEPHGVPYEKTQQEIVNNFLNNKPLLNYIPVYNTEYGQWNGEKEVTQKVDINKKPKTFNEFTNILPSADPELHKLEQIITRLKNDMLILSSQAKQAYDHKINELEEVKKLNNDLKIALQNTDILKNNLHTHEKLLKEFAKSIQDSNNGFSRMNQSGVEEFLKMIENLEMMVRNISYKYGRKLGM